MDNEEAIALLSEWTEKRLFYSLEHKESIVEAVTLAIKTLELASKPLFIAHTDGRT